jgi:hypothetical protein
MMRANEAEDQVNELIQTDEKVNVSRILPTVIPEGVRGVKSLMGIMNS